MIKTIRNCNLKDLKTVEFGENIQNSKSSDKEELKVKLTKKTSVDCMQCKIRNKKHSKQSHCVLIYKFKKANKNKWTKYHQQPLMTDETEVEFLKVTDFLQDKKLETSSYMSGTFEQFFQVPKSNYTIQLNDKQKMKKSIEAKNKHCPKKVISGKFVFNPLNKKKWVSRCKVAGCLKEKKHKKWQGFCSTHYYEKKEMSKSRLFISEDSEDSDEALPYESKTSIFKWPQKKCEKLNKIQDPPKATVIENEPEFKSASKIRLQLLPRENKKLHFDKSEKIKIKKKKSDTKKSPLQNSILFNF